MLTAIVSVETILLVALVVLVAALLRSHAEILRRLGPESLAAPLPEPRLAARGDGSAPALAGVTPTGDAVRLAFDGRSTTPTLLAFLSTGCTSCAHFFDTLGERRPADGLETVIVTRGADREQRVRLRSLAPPAVAVVMSSEAWQDYSVPGSPYFVLIDGGAVVGEGVATTWQALNSLVADAIEEQRDSEDVGDRHGGIDDRLAAAGIGPDHPSLFPGREG